MVMVRRRRRKIIIIVCAISIVLAASATGYWLLFARPASPLPKDMVVQATFPVYYPKELPNGYSIDTKDIVSTDGMLYYTLKTLDDTHNITITLQAVPKGFDPTVAIGDKTVPTTITPNGTLYDFSKGKTTKYMLSTGKTLLYITSASTTETKDIMTIITSLDKVKI